MAWNEFIIKLRRTRFLHSKFQFLVFIVKNAERIAIAEEKKLAIKTPAANTNATRVKIELHWDKQFHPDRKNIILFHTC